MPLKSSVSTTPTKSVAEAVDPPCTLPVRVTEPDFTASLSSSNFSGETTVMVRFAASITGSLQPVGLPVIEKLSMLEAEKPTVTASPALRKTAGESNAIVPDSLSLLHEAKKTTAATAQTNPANLFI